MTAPATLALSLWSEARLADPVWLHAAWVGPLVLLIGAAAIASQRRAVSRLLDSELVGSVIAAVSWPRRWLRVLLVSLACLLIAGALARPQSSPREREVTRQGRDLVFVIDVSRSMLADDLAPTRLDRAKLWIRDVVDTMRGDRVGLVAFAGAAVIKSPLTHDRAFFELALDQLNPDSAPRGGTKIGDAIRKTTRDVFGIREDEGEDVNAGEGAAAPLPGGAPRHRDIILITDGEDQESFPVEAAAAASAAGVRIIAIGLGDADEGTVLRDENGETITFQGSPVRSRLDGETLRRIATMDPRNAYLEVGTGEIDLEEVYRDLIASAEQTTLGSASIIEYEERFYLFIAAALVLLTIEGLIGERRTP